MRGGVVPFDVNHPGRIHEPRRVVEPRRDARRRWLAGAAACACAPAMLAGCGSGDASMTPQEALKAGGPADPADLPLARAWRVADFLARAQDDEGAIADQPGGELANEDSNLEYALIGLAAAYRAGGDERHLSALERGILWLAHRMETSDPFWRGSWRLAYSSAPPYDPVAVSPGATVADARGVGATSALFAYLLHAHQRVSGRPDLAADLAPHARAALDFVIARNRAADGYFYSSWLRERPDGPWQRWPYQYSADQGDIYLGMRAGALLYPDPGRRYAAVADFLQQNAPTAFFDQRALRYATGRQAAGRLDTSDEDFDGIFPQGYLSWIWPDRPQSLRAAEYLQSGIAPDGSVIIGQDRRAYSLSAALVLMAAGAAGRAPPAAVRSWLVGVPFDPADGAIRDTSEPDSVKFSNVAGFVLLGLLGWRPFD